MRLFAYDVDELVLVVRKVLHLMTNMGGNLEVFPLLRGTGYQSKTNSDTL